MKRLFNKIKAADSRTALVGKNILATFLIKGWSVLVQLFLVPVTLHCLNQYEYGIWLTINSILVWVDTMDIGLGNGLRNRLTETIAMNDKQHAGTLVSTAFVMLALIVVPTVSLLCLLLNHADVYSMLNVQESLAPHLNGILMMSLAFVGLSFIFKFVGNIYLALQLPMVSNGLVVGGQTLAFLLIWILSYIFQLSLLDIALIYTASPLAVYLLAYPVTFSKYGYLTPSISKFRHADIKPLFSLGFKFFFTQLAGMMIFATSNIIISKLFSPSEVTTYQISYKYFSITNMLFTIISMPLWSATTDAYTVNDMSWIKRTLKKMNMVMAAFTVLLILMTLAADFIYALWVGSEIKIPYEISCAMGIYMFVLIFGTNYSNIICGMGKVTLLTIITCVEAVIYIPLSVTCGQKFGTIGVLIALILVNSVSAVVNKIQCGKLLTSTATGIWNK